MPRQVRIEYADAIYHAMNRGNRREPIFHDDKDRQEFVSALGQTCGKTIWPVLRSRLLRRVDEFMPAS